MCDFELDKMPEKGVVYALLRSGIVYTSYHIENGKIRLAKGDMFSLEELKEGHFFDEEKEYRIIKRESRNDLLKLLFTKEQEEAMDEDLLYTQSVLVEDKYVDASAKAPGRLTIINRYEYSEDDTLVLRNYRVSKRTVPITFS